MLAFIFRSLRWVTLFGYPRVNQGHSRLFTWHALWLRVEQQHSSRKQICHCLNGILYNINFLIDILQQILNMLYFATQKNTFVVENFASEISVKATINVTPVNEYCHRVPQILILITNRVCDIVLINISKHIVDTDFTKYRQWNKHFIAARLPYG